MKSIKHRLYRQNGIIIISVVLIFEVIFLWVVRNYYFESAKKQLLNKADISGAFYNTYLINEKIHGKARYILENESKNLVLYMQVFDTNKIMMADSNGLKSSEPNDSEDIVEALNGRNRIIITRDKETYEKIMAISTPLYYLDNISGALRYVISVEDIDAMVGKISSIAFIIGVGVIIAVFLLSSFLAKDIAQPIKELTNIAEIMAKGDFSRRSIKRNDDEIGQLSDTLNHMANEIQRSNSVKNEFITSVSHELRTPLTAIQGWSEVILAGEVENSEEEKEGLEIIASEAKRLSGLVEQLLDFSKFESGKITLDIEKIDINELTRDIFGYFKKRFDKSSITANLKLDGKSIIVMGDKNRLKQVLINIIDNAIKFTLESGEIAIQTVIGKESTSIEIQDNGIGIPCEEIEKVTEKFHKGKSKNTGSGIGLAICKEIIDLHSGELHISSVEGQGTKVSIILPIKL